MALKRHTHTDEPNWIAWHAIMTYAYEHKDDCFLFSWLSNPLRNLEYFRNIREKICFYYFHSFLIIRCDEYTQETYALKYDISMDLISYTDFCFLRIHLLVPK